MTLLTTDAWIAPKINGPFWMQTPKRVFPSLQAFFNVQSITAKIFAFNAIPHISLIITDASFRTSFYIVLFMLVMANANNANQVMC